MNNGWVKLYRECLDHDMLANDNTAFIVFTKLLLRVKRNNGSYITGRFKLGELTNLKPTTAWRALKRLENDKMVTLSSDNKKTLIRICNWEKWQGNGDTSGDNKVTTKGQQSDTKQEVRIKKEEYNTNVLVETQKVYDLYCKLFEKNPNTFKLTGARKMKIKTRLRQNGLAQIEEAIRNTAASQFHRGDNDRGWVANLDFIIRSEEKVEELSQISSKEVTYKSDW